MYSEPKITIDLREYNYLLEKSKPKEGEIDYDHAYSILLGNILKYGISNGGRMSNIIKIFNTHTQYECIVNNSPDKEFASFKITPKPL